MRAWGWEPAGPPRMHARRRCIECALDQVLAPPSHPTLLHRGVVGLFPVVEPPSARGMSEAAGAGSAPAASIFAPPQAVLARGHDEVRGAEGGREERRLCSVVSPCSLRPAQHAPAWWASCVLHLPPPQKRIRPPMLPPPPPPGGASGALAGRGGRGVPVGRGGLAHLRLAAGSSRAARAGGAQRRVHQQQRLGGAAAGAPAQGPARALLAALVSKCCCSVLSWWSFLFSSPPVAL